MVKYISNSNAVKILVAVKEYIDNKIDTAISYITDEIIKDEEVTSNALNDLDIRLSKLEEKDILTKEQAERLIKLLDGLFDSDESDDI